MSASRQRRCRICRTRPVWIGGDVKDAQGTCKRCYHQFVWTDRPQAKRAGTSRKTPETAPESLWELGMHDETERLSREFDGED